MVKLTIQDVAYNFEMTGAAEKRPLLLLHGFTGSSQNWQPLLPLWAHRFLLLTVDLLGHGRSSAPLHPARYSIENAAADLIYLLDQLAIEQTNLLGYSMGGRLALFLAARYPHRFSTLILESASPGLRHKPEREMRRQQDNALAARLEAEGIDAFVAYWESLPLWASQQQLPAETRAAVRQLRLQNNATGLANSLRGMGTGVQPAQWGRLEKLQLPVLLIAGELDTKFVAINQEMAGLLPDVQLEIVPGAGHAVHLERPWPYAALVEKFLRDIGRR